MAFLKSIALNILTGATATTSAAMVLVAYSDHVPPANHPYLACAGMIFPIMLVVNVVLLMLWVIVKWKRAWLPLLGFLLSYPAIRIYMPLHFSSQPPEGSLKVITYNVACYNYKAKQDEPLDTIVSYLRRQQADIVCLQEDANARYSTIDSLAAIFPYNDTVHVNSPRNPMINAVGIHTRFPIVGKKRIEYESNANGSVAFYLLIGTDTVIVINNHFESTHLSDTDRNHYTDIINGSMNTTDAKAETRMLMGKIATSMAKRAPQAEAVSRFVTNHSRYPLIVCGDFNDTPISYTHHTVSQGLTDCYVESGNGPGISFNRRGFFFRIDNILCSSHYRPYNCYVDDQMDGSDHYPIVCWLENVKN